MSVSIVEYGFGVEDEWVVFVRCIEGYGDSFRFVEV